MMLLHKRLKQLGILGINRRNADYTLKYNDRRLYPLVDDKVLTKEKSASAGIPVPELYAIVEIQRQIKDLPPLLDRYGDFVIKPSRGSGGEGIVVISGRSKKMYRAISGRLISGEELGYHVSNILSGIYSLGGQPDKAIIEYRVKADPVFEAVTYLGVPDLRVIVFKGIPVMAMVRLPTRISDGKANLHQGAIGAGIDIADGKTLTAVWNNEIITEHPDTGNSVTGIEIPHWDQILSLASRCYELTGLGYQGVDIVLDRQLGPLILELNARPGLNIQIANRAGLLLRLEKAEENYQALSDVESRISFAREHFNAALFA